MSVVVTSYVIVKGSVYSTDCTVFGLERSDEEQVFSQFPSPVDAMNGRIVKASAVTVINLLAKIGFKVVSSTGEAETVWTLEARRTQTLAQQQQQKQQEQKEQLHQTTTSHH